MLSDVEIFNIGVALDDAYERLDIVQNGVISHCNACERGALHEILSERRPRATDAKTFQVREFANRREGVLLLVIVAVAVDLQTLTVQVVGHIRVHVGSIIIFISEEDITPVVHRGLVVPLFLENLLQRRGQGISPPADRGHLSLAVVLLDLGLRNGIRVGGRRGI